MFNETIQTLTRPQEKMMNSCHTLVRQGPSEKHRKSLNEKMHKMTSKDIVSLHTYTLTISQLASLLEKEAKLVELASIVDIILMTLPTQNSRTSLTYLSQTIIIEPEKIYIYSYNQKKERDQRKDIMSKSTMSINANLVENKLITQNKFLQSNVFPRPTTR